MVVVVVCWKHLGHLSLEFDLKISPPRLDSEEGLPKGDEARDVQDGVREEVSI